MAIDPTTDVFASVEIFPGLTAAVNVDISAPPVNDPYATSAKALGVYLVNGADVGGGGLTDEELRASAVPVSGPITNAQFTAVEGTSAAVAYADPTGAAAGTVVSLLKGIYVQLAIIATNTTPVV